MENISLFLYHVNEASGRYSKRMIHLMYEINDNGDNIAFIYATFFISIMSSFW